MKNYVAVFNTAFIAALVLIYFDKFDWPAVVICSVATLAVLIGNIFQEMGAINSRNNPELAAILVKLNKQQSDINTLNLKMGFQKRE